MRAGSRTAERFRLVLIYNTSLNKIPTLHNMTYTKGILSGISKERMREVFV
jgi:hypothetical protein